jgi:hypothetical protein
MRLSATKFMLKNIINSPQTLVFRISLIDGRDFESCLEIRQTRKSDKILFMLARIFSCAVVGLEGVVIEVEVDYTNGLPGMTMNYPIILSPIR